MQIKNILLCSCQSGLARYFIMNKKVNILMFFTSCLLFIANSELLAKEVNIDLNSINITQSEQTNNQQLQQAKQFYQSGKYSI